MTKKKKSLSFDFASSFYISKGYFFSFNFTLGQQTRRYKTNPGQLINFCW